MNAETKRRVRKALEPYKPHLFNYKGEYFALTFDPRKGECEKCGKKIGDPYIDWRNRPNHVKCTHLHHLKYDDDHPLDNTVELCDSCHNRDTAKSTVLTMRESTALLIKTGKWIRVKKLEK